MVECGGGQEAFAGWLPAPCTSLTCSLSVAGLLKDPRFQHQPHGEFMAAHRAAKRAKGAREAALAKEQLNREAPPPRTEAAAPTSWKRKAADPPAPEEWPHCPADSSRPRFTSADFQTSFATERRFAGVYLDLIDVISMLTLFHHPRSWYSRFAHIVSAFRSAFGADPSSTAEQTEIPRRSRGP